MPGTFVKINPATDTITDTAKVTTGYFSNGSGKLLGSSIYTSSLNDTNEGYYFGITNSEDADHVTQFTVAYGHYAGSGSNTDANDIKGATQAIYNQWATTLLGENEVTGGFVMSSPSSDNATATTTTVKDEAVYVVVGKRSLFKERLNKGNWTIALSGSNTAGDAGTSLVLTDDSKTVTAVSTVAGPRHNIVTGSDGTVHSASAERCFGWFYPDAGVLVFSAAELSRSIQGKTAGIAAAATENLGADGNFNGFGFNTAATSDKNYNNGLRFINCLKSGDSSATYIQARSEEDQTSVSYFCRATAGQFNFTNNPTFVSGSSNSLRHTDMYGNPVTYITGVGLYNTSGQLVAIAKLSTPLKKNFSSEATIKVKLTY